MKKYHFTFDKTQKAKNLAKRVINYTSLNNLTRRLQRMVSLTKSMNFSVTNTEVEALLLECNLIKRHKPKFNKILRGNKNIIINDSIPAPTNVTIDYRGYLLDQDSLDIWAKLFYHCQDDFSKQHIFKKAKLLKSLGKDTGGTYQKWLDKRMKSLSLSCVDICYKPTYKEDITYSGPLLNASLSDGNWSVSFNEGVVNLLDMGFSITDLSVRQALKTNNIAKFLYEYGNSRTFKKTTTRPSLISLTKLQEYANPLDTGKPKSEFKRQVKSAIDQLNAIKDICFSVNMEENEGINKLNIYFTPN